MQLMRMNEGQFKALTAKTAQQGERCWDFWSEEISGDACRRAEQEGIWLRNLCDFLTGKLPNLPLQYPVRLRTTQSARGKMTKHRPLDEFRTHRGQQISGTRPGNPARSLSMQTFPAPANETLRICLWRVAIIAISRKLARLIRNEFKT